MLENLKKLDYFNIPIKLRFNGNDNHYSILGMFLTIILSGVFIIISYYFG
jgi:hypothetical protein